MKERVIKVIRRGAGRVTPSALSSQKILSRQEREDARDMTKVVNSWINERRENNALEIGRILRAQRAR